MLIFENIILNLSYMKYLLLIVVISISIVSCRIHVPISKTPPQNNSTYVVDYLFEHDGVKVYRFKDEGRYVYFTNRGGEVTSVVNDSIQVRTQTTH